MKTVFIIALITFLASCQFEAQASDLRLVLKESVEKLTPTNCVESMQDLSNKIEALSVEDYLSEIKKEGHYSVLDDLFLAKIDIHQTMRDFYKAQNLTRPCTDSIRSAFRSIRTSEDTINDNFLKTHGESIPFPDNVFAEGNPHVQRHPQFSDFDLQKDLRSGDIILSRGNAFTSAAIANLGEFDTQFSHMSLVYKDENGKLWTVEAHIEVGSFVRPLTEHMADKNFRSMIYRFDDEQIAARAAHFIFHKVKNASDTTGNILYDFGFDNDHNEKLFCSEVISHAFKEASQGAVALPMFKSRLNLRKPKFVEMLGIEADVSFIPADIEVDPRFKVIAEGRNPHKIQDSLQKDAILQTMYAWNDQYGYQMRQASSFKSFQYRNIAWPLRRVPYLKKYFVKKLPLNMSRKLIGYFGVLESIGELLQKELKVADDKARSESGVVLLKSEKRAFLDQVRTTESKVQKKLHKMYRPTSK